jgi:hypothetical protein
MRVNSVRVFLAVLLVLVSAVAHSASFAFQGYCYATPADVLVAFQNQFPIVGEIQYTSHVSSSITAAGVVTYTLSTRAITSNLATNRTGSMQMVPCAKVDAPLDYTVAGALFIFFFSSVVMLWFAAKNAGVIVAAVRRF